jgi:hypothetical protein
MTSKLTTTLARIEAAGACADGYKHLVTALGSPSRDKVITALDVFRANGAEDTEWLLKSGCCFEDTAAALAEFRRVSAPAWAEYRRVANAAWAEYERVTAPALAEFRRVTAPALAEYDRVKDAALAEYERVKDAALAEYRRVTDAAWGTILSGDEVSHADAMMEDHNAK